MDKVIAVVVTYNRLECLKKVIVALKGQTIKLDKIIIINNGSTDGTAEYLMEVEDVMVITQSNIGGSGGFWRGIDEASKYPADWIWCMDDDVYPHENCLEKLLQYKNDQIGILCPRRIQNNKVFYSEYKKLNLSNPFKALHLKPLNDTDVKDDMPVCIEGMVFEGPLIKREVVEKIGLPQKDLFIFYDDTDYSYRAILAGFKVVYIPTAIMDKENFNRNLSKVQIINNQRWKTWYHIRNTAFFVNSYSKNLLFKWFGELYFPIHMFFAILVNLPRNKKYEVSDIKKLIHAFVDGKAGKLGKMSF